MSKDFFANKASAYDQDNRRAGNVDNIANAVINGVALKPDMHLMDFGAGTGLLLERVAPYVKAMTAVDISTAMIEVLQQKQSQLDCELEIVKIDLEQADIEPSFDGIISSMTMHHIRDVEAMFDKFYRLVKSEGFIAIADLDKEDGRFHSEDTGVYHFGFEQEWIKQVAERAGFTSVQVKTVSVIDKPHGQYPVFLLTAMKP